MSGILEDLQVNRTLTRRGFLKGVTLTATALCFPAELIPRMAEAASSPSRPPVIWLHFQECTGCTETLLRGSHPDVARLILDLISVDYHETIMAAAGDQAEEALHASVDKYSGKFILVVEGGIPTKDNGVYCKIGGKPAISILQEIAPKAAAVIAIGTCAAFGGVQAADPNPTGVVGVGKLLKKPVVNISGCPPNPVNFLGTVLHFMTFGRLPKLDKLGRPLFAYGRRVHDQCERRAHFDEGRFAEKFGDEGHRKGYCLYKLGCKGPETYSNCPVARFNDVGAWPVGIGHGCVGCTEPGFWDSMAPYYERLPEVAGLEIDEAGMKVLGVAGAAVGIHAAVGIVKRLVAGGDGSKDASSEGGAE